MVSRRGWWCACVWVQCRFLVYKGRDERFRVRISDLVVKPSHSIITQSFSCRERKGEGVVPPTLNGDGFGIGEWGSAIATVTLRQRTCLD